jgi:hypothetical protein
MRHIPDKGTFVLTIAGYSSLVSLERGEHDCCCLYYGIVIVPVH